MVNSLSLAHYERSCSPEHDSVLISSIAKMSSLQISPHHDFNTSNQAKTPEVPEELIRDRVVLSESGDLVVLYPFCQTFCSLHPKIRVDKRPIQQVMMHLGSKAHFSQISEREDGTKAVKPMTIISLCEYCGKKKVNGSILVHFSQHHPGKKVFREHHSTNLAKISSTKCFLH